MDVSRGLFHPFARASSRMILASFAVLCFSLFGMWALSTFRNRATALVEEDRMVPMRDGIRLHTKIWRPQAPGRYPVVLSRGYNPTGPAYAGPLAAAGYAYVGQAT